MNILKQTPKGAGTWNNIQFTFDNFEECDYLIVYNRLANKIHVKCPEENIWLISGEPPNSRSAEFHKSYPYFSKIITPDQYAKEDPRIHLSHGALPWHLLKSYDFLSQLQPGEKHRSVSCISSNKSELPGQRERWRFVEELKNQDLGIHFYGRETNHVADKYDALYPYKYSIAIENSSCPYYFSEKIMDCFLSFTIPIYYGCSNLEDYFPEKSFIQIDIYDVKGTIAKIKKATENNYWEVHYDALVEARKRVLNKYQLFPFISNLVNNHTSTSKPQYWELPKIKVSWDQSNSQIQLRNNNNRKTMLDMNNILVKLFLFIPKKIYRGIQKKKAIKSQIKKWEQDGCPIPPPHIIKQITIKQYQKKFNYHSFIETGTQHGDMVAALRRNFRQIKSIELAEKLFLEAEAKFSKYNNIEIIKGDSGRVLPELVTKLEEPAIFWLDGHYSAGETARGDKDCPIMEELSAIFKHNKKHVILIDDARDFVGKNDYPTIEELRKFITQKDSEYKLEVEHDIIRVLHAELAEYK